MRVLRVSGKPISGRPARQAHLLKQALFDQPVQVQRCGAFFDTGQLSELLVPDTTSLFHVLHGLDLPFAEPQYSKCFKRMRTFCEDHLEPALFIPEIWFGQPVAHAIAQHPCGASPPALDEAREVEHLSKQWVPWTGGMAFLSQVLDGDTFRKTAGIPDLDALLFHADLYLPDCRVVAVYEGIDDRFSKGIKRIFPDLSPLQSLDGRLL